MKRLKILMTVFFLIALPLALTGCGLVGALRTNKAEISSNMGEELPEWLTVAHRVEAVPQPVRETEDDESKENGAGLLVNQPASTPPGSTQPAQQAPPASGTPRWQQPGTMEYIAKQRLDQLVFSYKRLNSDIADLEAKKDKIEKDVTDLKDKKIEREKFYKDTLVEIANGLGLSLEKEYGIKPPPVEIKETTTDSTWFHNWEDSPSGFGN